MKDITYVCVSVCVCGSDWRTTAMLAEDVLNSVEGVPDQNNVADETGKSCNSLKRPAYQTY